MIFRVVDGEFADVTSALGRVTAAGILDKDLPHEVCGDSKEMSTVLPGWRRTAGKPHVSLMHQGRALQRVFVAFFP